MLRGYLFRYFLILFLSFLFCFQARAENVPELAQNYTPNLWFDSQEKYYPANPLDFYFKNNLEISGEDAVDNYNKLSDQEKLNNLTVFYHIEDEGEILIYQYWFFYVFNDYQKGVKNKHYGDWEAVYVFVDKNSKEVIKAIGTSHQRKIFDTEIDNPETNHAWTYVGNGSHANCVDNTNDGSCDFYMWNRMEQFNKNGHKVMHDGYKLVEITSELITKFNNSKTLQNSPTLGINIFDFLMMNNKEMYLPLGGNPPIYAWEQSSYYNPNEAIPISTKYIAEYASNKIDNTKNAIAGFLNNTFDLVNNLFKDSELENQQASVVNKLILPEKEEEIIISNEKPVINEEIIPEIVKIPEKVEEKKVIKKEEVKVEVVEEIKKEIEIEPEVKTEEIKENKNTVSSTPPLGLPFFIGGVSTPTLTPISTSTPTSTPDIIPPSDIIDLTAITGNSRGTINLSWTAPGDDQLSGTSKEYIVKYATSSVITSLNWASSTDITNEPIPSIASTTETLLINNLDINQIYYFAIKSKDEANNNSNISNCTSSTASALGDNVVINEIQLGSNEFVELYNPTNSDIDMSGWYWSYFSNARDWNNPYRNQEFPSGAVISAGGYYLIGLNGYPETGNYLNSDWQVYSSSQLSGTNGSISIFPWDPTLKTSIEAQNGAIDTLAWGSVSHVYEISPIPPSEDNRSLTRRVNGWDTNDNTNDFIESNWPIPQNSQGDKVAIIADSFSFTEDTIWTLNDGVYILESNLGVYPTIQDGAVLTIEPGVVIKGVNKNYPSLVIKGTLKAQGTSANPITFKSATTTQLAGDWSGIIFDNSTSTDSVLDYVFFEYGGYQTNYGGNQIKEMIRVENSYVNINNATFKNSLYHGIYLNNSDSLINNSNFNNNILSGIVISSSSPNINNSQFNSNDIGIEIINQASPIITNNIFSNNNKAIRIKSSYPDLSSNQVNNNIFNGVFIDSESIFSQNITWKNDLVYILDSGSGVFPTVATGTILTIDPGVTIKPYNKNYTALLIEGELVALGATSTPITFTSFKEGSAIPPAVNDWKNIQFIAGSRGDLNHINFKYGNTPVLVIDANANVNLGSDIIYFP